MGTNYYFMSRNKELIHLNKLSCGWRPLFQKHRAFDSFRELEAFYREHQADLEIYDEYGRQYS